MKCLQLLYLLAISAFPTLSQSKPATNKDFTSVAALKSASNVIPWACNQSNLLIGEQLAEITHLKSKNIPIPHDLAGYLYAVVKGRKLLGCPDLNPFNTHQQNTTTSTLSRSKRSSTSEAAEVEEILCKPARILKEDVMEQIDVLKGYQIPIPDYLAGWWAVTKDADSFIKCGFNDMAIGSANASKASD